MHYYYYYYYYYYQLCYVKFLYYTFKGYCTPVRRVAAHFHSAIGTLHLDFSINRSQSLLVGQTDWPIMHCHSVIGIVPRNKTRLSFLRLLPGQ